MQIIGDSKTNAAVMVTREVANDLHALIAKTQSATVRLSECLAQAIGLASRLGNDLLADFSRRELAPYFCIEGETQWPAWRRTDSYKIPSSMKLSRQSFHKSEDSFLDEFSATLHAPLTPDFWVPSVGDTEESLKQIDDEARSGKGFTLFIRTLPANMYTTDPDLADVELSVIVPSKSIREVIRKTRHEFVRRLLEIEKSISLEPLPTTAAAAPTVTIGTFQGVLGSVTGHNVVVGHQSSIRPDVERNDS